MGHLSLDGSRRILLVSSFFFFFVSFFFSYFSLILLEDNGLQMTVIYCKNGESHSDPVCTECRMQKLPGRRRRARSMDPCWSTTKNFQRTFRWSKSIWTEPLVRLFQLHDKSVRTNNTPESSSQKFPFSWHWSHGWLFPGFQKTGAK